MPDGDQVLENAAVCNLSLRKEGDHLVVEIQLTLVCGNADQSGHDALGHRGDFVECTAVEGIEVGVEDQVVIADHRQAVNVDILGADRLQPFRQFGRVKPLFFGRARAPAFRGPIGGGRRLDGRLLWGTGREDQPGDQDQNKTAGGVLYWSSGQVFTGRSE